MSILLAILTNQTLILSDLTDIKDRTAGAGETALTYYVYEDETTDEGPIGNCKVWVTTDIAGDSIVASGYTDDNGKVTFYLNSGETYYLWRKKTGWNFTNPDTEIAV